MPPETTETTGTTTPIVSVLNQKGGVGKTTLTIHLAGALSQYGYDVLVVDLEPEGALTSILGYDESYSDTDRPVSLHELLVDPAGSAAAAADLVQSGPEFDVLPANERMVDTTASALESEPKARERLAMALDPVADAYDLILVDNEPSINVLTDNALRCADGVVIPSYAEALSVQGLDRLQKQIASIEAYYGPVNVTALVVNRIESNNQADAMLSQLHEHFGEQLPVVEIRKRVALQRSISAHARSIFAVEEECDMAEPISELATIVVDDVLPIPDPEVPADG